MAFKKLKYWFDKDLAELIASKLSLLDPAFRSNEFVVGVNRKVGDLELKARVEVIADELYHYLDEDFDNAVKVLLKILGPENPGETGMFSNYYWIMPIAKLIEKYGWQDFQLSMHAIEEVTKRNTGEYTIRPFLEKDQDKTLKVMYAWSRHENFHVRRLSCEGVRPRLPWASKLDTFIDNPLPVLPILENLKDDPSKYVQKSVANCTNDILKDNFEIGKSMIEDWVRQDISPQRKWIIKHALRNLIKKEHSWAFDVIRITQLS